MYSQQFSHKGPRRFSRPSRGPHAPHSSSPSAGRFRHGFKRPGSLPRGRRGGMGERIDPSRFINRAVITEEAEHFIPEHSFIDFQIDQSIKRAVEARKFETPTPIQDRAIPYILKSADVVGIANTGTGKTAAFLIPLIDKVLRNRAERVLVVVPTRELAIQIDTELKAFAKGMKIFSVSCVGGVGIGGQIAGLRHGYNFIIGTPGRLKDLIERKLIPLNLFKTIVLDEADRMLDMGFVNDMRYVVSLMPKARQTLFFSATISPEIEKLIKDFCKEPVRISVKTGDTARNVEQDVVRVARGADKLDVLHDLLNQKEFSKVLIFGRTKHGAERLSKELLRKGFKAESIHGNKSQPKRQKALTLFRDGHIQVLVATDVAARGLDIADVSHVINYDLPATYNDYVHRIGRTGRGNKRGKALTFIE